MPMVVLEGDSAEHAMANHGLLAGFSDRRAVWRFGFVPGSQLARVFGVAAEFPTWVLTFHGGTVIGTSLGSWARGIEPTHPGSDLPARFRHILEATL